MIVGFALWGVRRCEAISPIQKNQTPAATHRSVFREVNRVFIAARLALRPVRSQPGTRHSLGTLPRSRTCGIRVKANESLFRH